jgi:hypothetical protein
MSVQRSNDPTPLLNAAKQLQFGLDDGEANNNMLLTEREMLIVYAGCGFLFQVISRKPESTNKLLVCARPASC